MSQEAEDASTAVEIWSLFFTEEMLGIIVECTNKYVTFVGMLSFNLKAVLRVRIREPVPF